MNNSLANYVEKVGALSQDVNHILGSAPRKKGDYPGGAHSWIFWAAIQMHKLGIPEDMMQELLTGAVEAYPRRITEHEISQAISNSTIEKLQERGAVYSWPAPDKEFRNEIVDKYADHEVARMLRNGDPVPASCCETLRALYDPGDLLCLSEDRYPTVRPLEHFCSFDGAKLAGMQFIVPNPMVGYRGHTQDGKESFRTLENTGPRVYQVVEFDQENCELNQIALHRHLATYLPLVMLVTSGGKSVHGWYYCRGMGEESQKNFFSIACVLGGDPMTWVRCQYVRLPWGVRASNGKTQKPLYFKHLP